MVTKMAHYPLTICPTTTMVIGLTERTRSDGSRPMPGTDQVLWQANSNSSW